MLFNLAICALAASNTAVQSSAAELRSLPTPSSSGTALFASMPAPKESTRPAVTFRLPRPKAVVDSDEEVLTPAASPPSLHSAHCAGSATQACARRAAQDERPKKKLRPSSKGKRLADFLPPPSNDASQALGSGKVCGRAQRPSWLNALSCPAADLVRCPPRSALMWTTMMTSGTTGRLWLLSWAPGPSWTRTTTLQQATMGQPPCRSAWRAATRHTAWRPGPTAPPRRTRSTARRRRRLHPSGQLGMRTQRQGTRRTPGALEHACAGPAGQILLPRAGYSFAFNLPGDRADTPRCSAPAVKL